MNYRIRSLQAATAFSVLASLVSITLVVNGIWIERCAPASAATKIENGRIRVVQLANGEPAITLYDESGHRRFALRADGLTFFSPSGVPVVRLRATEYNSLITLRMPSGTGDGAESVNVQISVDTAGDALLLLSHKDGTAYVRADAVAGGASISVGTGPLGGRKQAELEVGPDFAKVRVRNQVSRNHWESGD